MNIIFITNAVELTILTSLIFIFFTFFLIPSGHIISSIIFKDQPENIISLLGLGLSIIIFSSITSILTTLSVGIFYSTFTLRTFCFLSFTYWILSKKIYSFFSKEMIYIFFLIYTYMLLASGVSSFPDLNYRNVSAILTQELLSLPIDNIIPYNFSRYITEQINPTSLEVAPLWKATDRGPIAGLINATSFLILGISESNSWLDSTPGLFFIFQNLITYLNLFSLVAVFIISSHFSGIKAGSIATLFLITCPFYFINIIFSWPKFLMAYFVLCSFYMKSAKIKPLHVGIISGAAALSHDSALFFTLSLAASYFFDYTKKTLLITPVITSFSNFFRFSLGYLMINFPWIAYKKFFCPPSPRLIYFHLFCDTRVEASNISLAEEIRYYLSINSISDIFNTRLHNLSYPFNIFSPFINLGKLQTFSEYFVAILNRLPNESFHRFIYGFGVIPFFLILYSIYSAKKLNETERNALNFIFFGIFSSLTFVVLISGCRDNTSNHVWAYPLFLASAIYLGIIEKTLTEKSQVFKYLLIYFSILINATVTVLYIHYHSQLRPILHAFSSYFIFQGICALATLLIINLIYNSKK